MAAFQQKTIVRSYKLRIKNKFKSIVEETDNITTLLQDHVQSFKDETEALVNANDENFYSEYEKLDSKFEVYREKLYFLLASLDQNVDEEEANQLEKASNHQEDVKVHEDVKIQEKDVKIQEKYVKIQEKDVKIQEKDVKIQEKDVKIKEKDVKIKEQLEETKSIENFPDKNSSQTFCKTSFSSGTSVKTSSFCSLQDDYQMINLSFSKGSISVNDFSSYQPQESLNTQPKFLQHSHDSNPQSDFSSKNSSYQSLPSCPNTSNISKYPLESIHLDVSQSDQCDSFGRSLVKSKAIILPPSISVPSFFNAFLSHIVSPHDFWMQIEDSKKVSFQSLKFGKKTSPLSVQPGDFCFALSNKVNMYYRAEVLTKTMVDLTVEVFFVDFGSIERVPIKNLRDLPKEELEMPMRAFHCSLSNIESKNGVWSSASIQKFKEYDGSCEVHVKSYNGGKYGVQLMIKIAIGFPINVSEVLCDEGFAVNIEEFSENLPSPSLLTDKTSIQQVSHDSGVSVTSNHRFCPFNERPCFRSEMRTIDCDHPLHSSIESPHHHSSEGFDKFCNGNVYDYQFENETSVTCLRTKHCGCPLHLVVPPPILATVEEGRMLVMLSNIVSPSEFYVNPAMEDSITLDELLEEMTAFYESHFHDYTIALKDLREGLFCAGRFYEDQSWYRVKILQVYFEDGNVKVQYIDYGNKATIKCYDLRPLKEDFVQHPAFALECSLAGIVPLVMTIEEDYSPWDPVAVEEFKKLTNYDRCLTAEIVEHSALPKPRETIPVLLWDTEKAQDLCINEALVSKNVAMFHKSLLSKGTDKIREADVLKRWNPMVEKYDDVENSYAVNEDDIGIATSGYIPNDDSRICRYFSLQGGSCPRGDNCEYEHVLLGEGGVTRDQVEDYSLDPEPSLPNIPCEVLLQISSVVNPERFYAVLPFGNKTIEDMDYLLHRGSKLESEESNEVAALFCELNDHYSNLPFDENTTVALSFGSIVVAWRKVDSSWHRARVIDFSGIAEPATVFFVDFGDTSEVPRKKIRTILPEYLYTPFQAIECHMADIEPLGFEKGKRWSAHSIHSFKQLVSGATFLAHIISKRGKVLVVILRGTTQSDKNYVCENLVHAGFAQYRSKSISKKPESIYVPG